MTAEPGSNTSGAPSPNPAPTPVQLCIANNITLIPSPISITISQKTATPLMVRRDRLIDAKRSNSFVCGSFSKYPHRQTPTEEPLNLSHEGHLID